MYGRYIQKKLLIPPVKPRKPKLKKSDDFSRVCQGKTGFTVFCIKEAPRTKNTD